jgi:ribosomal protein L29
MPKKTTPKKQNQSEDMGQRLAKLRSELVQLQLEHSQGKLKNTQSLPMKRREIARLLTALSIARKESQSV